MPGGRIVFGLVDITFISLRGLAEPLAMVLEDITRPGVNGHAFREDARRAPPFTMDGLIDYTAFSAAEAQYNTLKGKVGTVGSVTDDRGTTTNFVVLLAVEKIFLKPIAGNIGGIVTAGAATALLSVRLHLQQTK